MEELMQIEDLSVSFSGDNFVQAVEHVSFTLKKGDHLCIIGETGSGKSILLLALLQLLPKGANVSGRVLYQDLDLLKLDEKQLDGIRGSAISYVPQGSGNGMNPLMRVGDQVGEPLVAHRGASWKQARIQSIALMRRFHLGREEQLAKQYPFTFSGGMRQRALIAMGIAANADILLADEPTKGLDEVRIQAVVEAFNELESHTIACVTHDLNFAGAVANRIGVMYAANLVELADAKTLLSNPLHPYTQDMIDAMPENGLKFDAGFAPAHDEAERGCKYYQRCKRRMTCCCEIPPMVGKEEHQVRCWLYV